MNARRSSGDDDDAGSEILRAIIDRGEEGMTVLELRAFVDADIDTIESRLTELKREGRIEIEQEGDRTHILPHESVMPEDADPSEDGSIIDAIQEWLRG